MKRDDRTNKARGASAPRPSFTDPTIVKEIEALRKMEIPDLIAKYEELWGKPPRLKNQEALFKRCAWKLQEIRVGGLSARLTRASDASREDRQGPDVVQ
jgi:hypothetical protein